MIDLLKLSVIIKSHLDEGIKWTYTDFMWLPVNKFLISQLTDKANQNLPLMKILAIQILVLLAITLTQE